MIRFEEGVVWLMIEPTLEDHPDEIWVQYQDQQGRFHRLHITRDLTIEEHIESDEQRPLKRAS